MRLERAGVGRTGEPRGARWGNEPPSGHMWNYVVSLSAAGPGCGATPALCLPVGPGEGLKAP